MSPVVKEFSEGQCNGVGNPDHGLNKSCDLIELAQTEIISELKDAIEKILFSKTMKVLAYAKRQAEIAIENERLSNKPGWMESLSEDVTEDEFKRYLGFSNLEAYISSETSHQKTPTAKPANSKPSPPEPSSSSLTIDELLNGAAKNHPLPRSNFAQSKPQFPKESTNNIFSSPIAPIFKKEDISSAGISVDSSKTGPTLGSLKAEQKENSSSGMSTQDNIKENSNLVSLLSKVYSGFTQLEVVKAKDENINKRKALFVEDICSLLGAFFDDKSTREYYEKFSSQFGFRNQDEKDIQFIFLNSAAQTVCNTVVKLPFKNKGMLSKMAQFLGLPVFCEGCEGFPLVLLAHLHKRCSAILPIDTEAVSLSEESIKIFAFYCVLLASDELPFDTRGLFKLSAAWQWIVAICRISPNDKYCIYLDIMLEICGPRIIMTYKDQGIKLLRLLSVHLGNFSELAAKQNRIRILNLMASFSSPAILEN